ncbi:uncharacterized protein LACBIDRAFT_318012 [Laccaria bicolor S238N-H82]|uniref:Predicted protein n=1 Tax=Laccaria bicolor (strain S238N-H82 / ATCC MYA-4686) TaxID=486041 RepID=B0D5R7_LACBS|nr:uncharacterized protein LACBIDRAFT_318012 [Laccaria bicolor S238N-H82]EDR10065.1 predicted protein [Laccaria bicolor S238N-H82]|eukprot:XP_001879450.1 predicted protein [Laccaria bicolor S238N-H82]
MTDHHPTDPGNLAKHYESHLSPYYELYVGYGDGKLSGSARKGSLFPGPPLNFSYKYIVSTFLMQFFRFLSLGIWSQYRVSVARVLDRVFDVASLPEILTMANETANGAETSAQQQQIGPSSELHFIFSLEGRWRSFQELMKTSALGSLLFCGMVALLTALNLYYHHASSFSVARVLLSWCFISAFNGVCSGVAFLYKFSHMEESFLAIEWTLAVKPTSFKTGLWWKVDLLTLPFLWWIWMMLFAFMGLIANAFESSFPPSQPAKSIHLAIAMGIFGGCNMLHAVWVIVTAGYERKAMRNAWQKRAERIRNGSDDLFACNSLAATQLHSDHAALKADVADVDQVGPEPGDGKYD